MNENNLTLASFEVIPLERMGTDFKQESIEDIVKVLQQYGFEEVQPFANENILDIIEKSDVDEIKSFLKKKKQIKILNIKNKEMVRGLAEAVFVKDIEDEFVWLVTEYFEYLFIFYTKYDLLFGLASTKGVEQVSPYNRRPDFIICEVGGCSYGPTIPRILISGALDREGFSELSKKLECTSNFPRETAIAGDIVFVDPPVKMELKNLSILSSTILNQEIVKLIQDESILMQVEIAKAFHYQKSGAFQNQREEQQHFSIVNHFSIIARKGSFIELLNELSGVALHLNWSITKEIEGKLSREEFIEYAIGQNARLQEVEEKEQRLIYSLGVLQKRYPDNVNLFEWEVNNLYSNIVRFSPVYLSFKNHLKASIEREGEDKFINSFVYLISQLNWSRLELNGIAKINEGEKLIKLLEIDPASTLTKMRVIIEKIVSYIFKKKFPSNSKNLTLANKLQKLNEAKIIPPFIYIYLNTVRLTGNIGAHEGEGDKEDAEALLPIFIRVVELFLDRELKNDM